MTSLAPCGTRSAYNRHLRRGEKACDACLEANRAHVAAWAQRNRERWLAINSNARAKYRSRPEVVERKREAARQYRRTEAGKAQSFNSNHARRAKIYGSSLASFRAADVVAKYGHHCYLCGGRIDLTVSGRPGWQPGWERGLQIDHVVPLYRGGAHTIDNVRPTHASCNMKKGAR